ncbi:MAG: hypothetical protein HUU47_00640 [Bacteroidetes bacterium]|nr:hypothetical protein [Bacteroidota bacterium]
MRFFKFILSFLIVFLKIQIINAQSLEWSNTTKIRGNSIYTTIVGEDENGIYVIRHRNKLLSRFVVFERYRHNLGLETSKSFLLKNTRLLYVDINKNGLLVIKQIYFKKSKTYNIVATYFNSVFEPKINDKILMNVQLHDNVPEPKIIIKPDETHSNYYIANVSNIVSKIKSFEYSVYDINLETKVNKTIAIDKKYKFDQIEDFVFENEYKLTFLASKRNIEDAVSQYFLLQTDNDVLRVKLLEDSNYLISQAKILNNNFSKTKIVSGFYTSSYKSGYEGQVFIKFRNIVKDSVNFIKTPFSKEIIKETEGEHKSQSGFIPATYKLKKIINCFNGSFVKVIENTIINKDQEIIGINGSPTSQGKLIYFFENLIIQNFDSSGNLVWESNINKIQNSINDGGILSSVFVSNTQNKINILYNYPVSNGGDIILADFTPLGTKQVRKIVDGDLFNALIISDEGKQISNNKIIVPVIKERKFALLKIQF